MCSLEYLSKKSLLMDEIRKRQLECLDLQNEYQILLKDETSDRPKFINKMDGINGEQAHKRNRRLLEDFQKEMDQLHLVLSRDDNYLRDLKSKYLLSVKDCPSLKIEEVSEEVYWSVEMLESERAKSPSITPHIKDSRERLRSPERLVPPLPTNVISGPTTQEKKVKSQEQSDLLSPAITPRFSDNRERMRSPSPSKHKSDHDISQLSNVSLDSEEEFVNDERGGEEVSVAHILALYDVIEARMDSQGKRYGREYLDGSKTSKVVDKGKEKAIRKILESRKTGGVAFDGAWTVKDLVAFVVDWLPKICVKIEFDLAELLDPSVIGLIKGRTKPTFVEAGDIIRKKLCRTNDQLLLWTKLQHHFQTMIQDGFLSTIEIAELYTPLLMPVSATVSNEENVTDVMVSWMSLIDDKLHPLSQRTMATTSMDTSLLSDDDTVTFSTQTSDPITKPKVSNLERTYSDLKKSINVVSHGAIKSSVAIDDDPNEDLNNAMLTRSQPTIARTNLSTHKLATSIKNIDDDIAAYDLVPTVSSNKPHDDDDDEFDFK